jgi:assimilatory nitrate reductase catalytic subunit
MVPVAPRTRSRRSAVVGSDPDPLTLVTGRLLEHYQSGAQTRRVAELAAAQPEALLQIHPATAAVRDITDGDFVRVSNERGEVLCRVELSNSIRTDTVFLPFHFPGLGSANLLTEAVTDPISGMPEFKTSTVWVRKAALPNIESALAGQLAVPAGAGLLTQVKEAS